MMELNQLVSANFLRKWKPLAGEEKYSKKRNSQWTVRFYH